MLLRLFMHKRRNAFSLRVITLFWSYNALYEGVLMPFNFFLYVIWYLYEFKIDVDVEICEERQFLHRSNVLQASVGCALSFICAQKKIEITWRIEDKYDCQIFKLKLERCYYGVKILWRNLVIIPQKIRNAQLA